LPFPTRSIPAGESQTRSSSSNHAVRLPLLALAACSIAAVGCGSGGAAADRARTEAAAQAARQVGDNVRFGGGWKTDFARHTVPLGEFRSGGPGKDGIPALDRPKFVEADHVDFPNAREPVIELVDGRQARAYPLQILTRRASPTCTGPAAAALMRALC